MKLITEFFNKTTLTVSETIILSVITTIICSMILPFIWKLMKIIVKSIYNYFKSLTKRIKMHIKGELTVKEYMDIGKKLEKGEKVSKQKLKIYNENVKKLKETFKEINIEPPKIPDLSVLKEK